MSALEKEITRNSIVNKLIFSLNIQKFVASKFTRFPSFNFINFGNKAWIGIDAKYYEFYMLLSILQGKLCKIFAR